MVRATPTACGSSYPVEGGTCGKRISEGTFMFLIVALALLVIWIICFLVLHVTAFFIHLLIIFAVISFIFHFIRGRRV